VHFDLNELRASSFAKELVSALDAAQKHATGGIIGIDIPKVLTTVGSVTAYGTNLSKDPKAIDGTLIAQGTADLRKIAESALLQATLAHPEAFTEVTDLPFPAYAIIDPKAPESARMQVLVAFPPEPIVIVSKSKAQLLKAREVFRGSAPSVAKTPQSPLTKLSTNAQGAFLFAATAVPTEPLFPQNGPQARMLQLASSGSIAFGERGPNTFLHADLLASSDNNAEKLMKILQGMTSFLSLAETNDRELEAFLNSTKVAREKDTVTLDLSYSSARLAEMVQSLRKSVEVRTPPRQPTIISGTVLSTWGGEGAAAESTPESAPASGGTRTIENVKLSNGSTITIGRALNGGKDAKFTSVEISPAEGTGAPLVFRPEFMRNVRSTMWQLQFPGADGTYNLKINYVPEPENKAKFAVSVRHPNDPETSPSPGSSPRNPDTKRK
jgi:hypothetical protein